MAATKIAVTLAVISSLLLLAGAIRPISDQLEATGDRPLEGSNVTVATTDTLNLEGFHHVDLSLRHPFHHHPFRHGGVVPRLGFRIHLSIDGLGHQHHYHHHGGDHRFHGRMVVPHGEDMEVKEAAEIMKEDDPSESVEAAAETSEGGQQSKAAEVEEEAVMKRTPSFLSRHRHHFSGHQFHGGWITKCEEIKRKRKMKKMLKKMEEEEDSDSDSDSDDDNDDEEDKEKEEKGGLVSWFRSIWSHHRHRHHHLFHPRRHHLRHGGHRFRSWMAIPEGDGTMLKPRWIHSDGGLKKDEEVVVAPVEERKEAREEAEQPKLLTTEEVKEAAGEEKSTTKPVQDIVARI